ncbi:MAG: hypothetical protein V5A34_08595 [Halapricum sp.]
MVESDTGRVEKGMWRGLGGPYNTDEKSERAAGDGAFPDPSGHYHQYVTVLAANNKVSVRVTGEEFAD